MWRCVSGRAFAGVAALFAVATLLLPVFAAGAEPSSPTLAVEALDEDSTPLTIDDVTRAPLSREFRPLSEMPNTDRNIVRWYRFVAPRTNGVAFVLSVDESTDDADLYMPRPNGSFSLERFGMRVPWNSRPYPSTLPAVGLEPLTAPGRELYVRTYGPATQLRFRPQRQFDELEGSIEHWTFCFAGFLFAIGMSSLFLSFYLRERAYVLQAALMGAALLFTLVDSQLAWKYVWPFASVDFGFADDVSFLVYLLMLLLFSRSFLSLGPQLPRLTIALWSAFVLNLIVTFVATPLAPDSSVLAVAAPLVNLLPFPLLLAAGILRMRQGFRQARFFTLGMSGMIVIFLGAGLLRQYSFARWGFDAGVAFDSLFFQFALADRLLAANRARDEAQRTALATQQQLVQSQQNAIATLAEHNEAFSRFVPHEFLALLNRDDIVAVKLGDHTEREMVVLFSDIRSSQRCPKT